MTDSFADLWNSTAPTKPAEPPKKLGALSAPSSTSNTRKPTNDVFSLLASSSASTSRSVTPSYSNTSQSATSSKVNVGAPIQKSSSSGGDAFSSLLSGTLASNSTNPTNMTIAQRAAQVERQRSEQLLQQQNAAKQVSAAWDGLDTLNAASSRKNAAPAKPEEDDWAFDFASPPPAVPTSAPRSTRPSPAQKPTALDDDWGLGDLVSQPAPVKARPAPVNSTASSQKTSATLLWDLDEFASSPSRNGSKRSPEPAIHRSNTPGDFDFGDREDGLLNDRSDDEDDILGDLSKPVDQIKLSSTTPSPQPPPSGQQSRAVSPPPHIVGQIVEMGFSPQQARVALAATETGLDVQAALETLLSNGAASGPPPSRPPPRNRESTGERRRYSEEDDEGNILPRRRLPREEPASQPRDTPSPAGGETQRNLQEQADKLLAQASEIGMTVFSRANAFWKQGKEKMQQVYEEQRAAKVAAAAEPVRDGRPRWMQDASERDEGREDEWGDAPRGDGFRYDDDDDDGVPPPRAAGRKPAAPKPKPQIPSETPRELEQNPATNGVRTGNLLADDTPAAYVSPWRRKTTPRSEIQTKSSRGATPAVTPLRNPSPIPLTQRKAVPAPPSALAASAKHKEAGTEMFKLGRYAEAETSYSTAISALPDSHLLLVPLYNNRALTRIKTGDHSGAIEDCTTVITLVGASYHPAREAKVTKEEEGSSVDLADGLVKAFRRRAEAYEGKERWDAARQDWEAIAGAEWAGKVRNEAVRGAGRCRRMLTANTDNVVSQPKPTVAAPPKPKPKPKPVRRGPTPPSVALNRVREANQAAEAEDQLRHELKDSIDAKLVAWKGGKETNIRALIASLDTVLWPELGWQKVGMHELISPNQVKIRYTKAIAKLHPDKLNVNNTTLEQRMIANGVFGSLNEAWNAFKP